MNSVPGRQIIICKAHRTLFIYFGTPPVMDISTSSFSYICDKTFTRIQVFQIVTLLKIETINTILGDRVHDGRESLPLLIKETETKLQCKENI